MKQIILSIVLVLAFISPLLCAESSEDYSLKSRKVYSAFLCEQYALFAQNKVEAQRLFAYGYKQGQEFYKALSEGKIEQDDINSTVPYFVTASSMHLPNIEFALGELHGRVVADVIYIVNNNVRESSAKRKHENVGGDLYRQGNCELLGR